MEVPKLSEIESEQIADSFLCCVCLELLYKPIVLACGHIACFWCVHKSMSGRRESRCPICRHPYDHFPSICQMLHFLLMKMYPVNYKKREDSILEEERACHIFSPRFDCPACEPHTNEKIDSQGESGKSADPSIAGFGSNSCSGPLSCGCLQLCVVFKMLIQKFCSSKETSGQHCSNAEQSESGSRVKDNSLHDIKQRPEAIKSRSIEGNKLCQNKINGIPEQISVADLLCAACKQLLFHPVVLNCGHVYCEACLFNPTDEMLRCQVCCSLEPRRFPKVCLEVDHFLEEKFPKEYSLRRDAVKEVLIKHDTASCSMEDGQQSISISSNDNPPWWEDMEKLHWSSIHSGFGCDSCGMYPIIGDRYKCKDCTEEIGYDLCGDCYNTSSKLPGRFNQQHTSEHRFEPKKKQIPQNLLLRVVAGPLGGEYTVIVPDDTEENLESGFYPSGLLSNSEETVGSDLNELFPNTGGDADENDSEMS
ncbi:E3 ubiquitin-protein ligase PRT1 isoform X2 [Carica papaya]|uniref:E3 ubiquitin-protein ligase PRT1 isoform X2 n=1 Tax=Carica papaya TaxID=3649 RepID=UPI000B8C7E29|nr:E3 ubiquitin-protein ligase PRT1 isoform X2 [Carica papaya]